MDQHGLSSINPHYLNRVMDLAEDATIEAGEDIYSANGVKLLAKGAQISRALQERLIRHKLIKPFETTIVLRSTMEADWLQNQARSQINQPLYAAALGPDREQSVWPVFAALDVRQPGLDLLLALINKTTRDTLHHATLTAMLAVRLGCDLGLNREQLLELAMAGLLHDVGNLYLDPALLSSSQNIPVMGWRQLSAHSLVGGMALRQIPGLNKLVIQATEEHHERCDGSGYPKGLKGQALSRASIIVGAANLIAELLVAEPVLGPVQISQALRLLIGEFPKEVMNHGLAIAARCRTLPVAMETLPDNQLPALFMRIGELQMGLQMLEENRLFNAMDTRQWLERMRLRLIAVQKLFSSTGIDQLAASLGDSPLEDQGLQLEIAAVAREIRRRLRELGQIGILQMVNLSPPAQECASPWLRLFLN